MVLQSVEYVVKTRFVTLTDEIIIKKYSNTKRWVFFLDITINYILQLFNIYIPTTFLLPGWTQTVTCILHLIIFWLIISYYRKIRDSTNLDFPPFKSSHQYFMNVQIHLCWTNGIGKIRGGNLTRILLIEYEDFNRTLVEDSSVN